MTATPNSALVVEDNRIYTLDGSSFVDLIPELGFRRKSKVYGGGRGVCGGLRSSAHPRACGQEVAVANHRLAAAETGSCGGGLGRRGVPVSFTTLESAAVQIEAWATYYFREKAKPFVTPSELGDLTRSLAMLCRRHYSQKTYNSHG
jgi:hypothetical protein